MWCVNGCRGLRRGCFLRDESDAVEITVSIAHGDYQLAVECPACHPQPRQEHQGYTADGPADALAGQFGCGGVAYVNHGAVSNQNRWASSASKHQGQGGMRSRGLCAR